MSRAAAAAGGVAPSPNIWDHPDIYEWENEAFDPEQYVEAAIDRLRPIAGARVLDIGCGAGFHLPRFAARGAASVVGLEPHPPLAARALARIAPGPHPSSLGNTPTRGPDHGRVSRTRPDPAGVGAPAGARTIATMATRRAEVVIGAAAELPFAAASFDLVVARWAYFFGPGCEPGLAQVERVVAPGGVAAFLDNDATRSTFGRWFRDGLPAYDALAVERFWRRRGFEAIAIDARWQCPDRGRFEAIVRIEFEPAAAERILAGHAGNEVDYAVNLWWRRF